MFIQNCFIRKNTKDLRNKLKEIGYKLNHGKVWGKYLACFKTEDTNECMFVASPKYDLEKMPNYINAINCGEDENLFLAIAALRDDSDYMQWFIFDEDIKIDAKIFHKKGEFMLHEKTDDVLKSHFYHKATVEELIEYFKNK